jgi:hypothetical protein
VSLKDIWVAIDSLGTVLTVVGIELGTGMGTGMEENTPNPLAGAVS